MARPHPTTTTRRGFLASTSAAALAFPTLLPANTLASGPPSLREAAKGRFQIGVGITDRITDQPDNWPLLASQFDTVTSENCLKPLPVQSKEGQFQFDRGDAFIKFATSKNLRIVGHCLVWARDNRTPPWFFQDGDKPASRELLLDRMRTHIKTVVGRYRGKIASWDVVNEALDDGKTYLHDSSWSRVCGEDFIVEAFRAAHEADPNALLNYNDYGTEYPAKRANMVRLIKSLQSQNIPIHAVGVQGHYELDHVPLAGLENTLKALRDLGVKVAISELDLGVIPSGQWWADGGKHQKELARHNPYPDGCPPEILARQADQYATLFHLFKRYSGLIERVSFWNLHDGQSWLNSFPWKRTNYPLLFDRQRQPKPAFNAVIRALNSEE